MNKLHLSRTFKSHEDQYKEWVEYLSRDKYEPSLENLDKLGFHHSELTLLRESLGRCGYSKEEVGQHQLNETQLKRMSLTETRLRLRFLNHSELIRLSLADYFYELENEQDCSLYLLTITYKPQPHELRIERVDSCFIKFHTQFLLPTLLDTKNIQQNHHRKLQPVAFAFLDEHRSGKDKFTKCDDPRRLHHHAILAVRPETKSWFEQRIGENTFFPIRKNDFSPYLTTDLTPCDAKTVLYASKMLETYPDFLSFPDKRKRVRNKFPHKRASRCSPKTVDAEKLFRCFKSNGLPWQKPYDSLNTPKVSIA